MGMKFKEMVHVLQWKEEYLVGVDLIDEQQDLATIRLAAYHQSVAKSYNKNVRVRMFIAGDWVIKKVLPNIFLSFNLFLP